MIPALILAQTLILPLRLHPGIGTESPVYSYQIELSAPANALELGAHSFEYRSGAGGKISVRVNNGSWVPISNTTAECTDLSKDYGCIGSVFSTNYLRVPIDIPAGASTVEFRFNYNERWEREFDGLSAGRVMDFDVVNGSTSVLNTPVIFRDHATLTASTNHRRRRHFPQRFRQCSGVFKLSCRKRQDAV